MGYSNIIFDFDGTLTDSKRDIADAQLWALSHLGVNNVTPNDIFPHIGKPVEETFHALLPNTLHHRIAEAAQHYAEYYPSRLLRTTALFPGVEETLLTLRHAGKQMAIASTKRGAGILRVTDHFGITDLFHALQGSDGIPCKPDPTIIQMILRSLAWSREDTLMVGDTDKDILAAYNAGIDSCGVSYGAFSKVQMSLCNPHHMIEHFSDLLPIVDVS